MKRDYAFLKCAMSAAEKACWKNYLDPQMKPEKNGEFKSYSRAYKQKLFEDPPSCLRLHEVVRAGRRKAAGKRFAGTPWPSKLLRTCTHFVEMDRASSDFDLNTC